MYKNFFWFMLGYFSAKHGAPILLEVIQQTKKSWNEAS